ncbi:IS5 family transposase [Rhizobium leguminosarum]|uniref:IS5 family transposase n=1 Tax=Rhizobium leguminosarum TaxID=384 RepID=UPI003F9A9FD4
MSDLLLLSKAQMRRIEPYFPVSHGIPRVDDRLILSGVIFVLRNGLRWRDARPHKTIYNRFIRWSRLACSTGFCPTDRQTGQARAVDDRRYPLESPPHRSQSAKKGDVHRRIGRTKGGLNSKLHAVCDGHGRPLILLLGEGQMSDYKGAAKMLAAFPKAKTLLGDKGYDADWFRDALEARKITACIPSRANRKIVIPHAGVYKKRHKIENMFSRLNDWRRSHTRYDRCAHTYFSSMCIAAAVIFWM